MKFLRNTTLFEDNLKRQPFRKDWHWRYEVYIGEPGGMADSNPSRSFQTNSASKIDRRGRSKTSNVGCINADNILSRR